MAASVADAQGLVHADALDEAPSGDQVAEVAENLQKRCDALLSEVTIFEQKLVEVGRAKQVELRTFTSSIRAEIKSLSRIGSLDQHSDEQRLHMLRSANVAFYEAVWLTAKHSAGVTGFLKRFPWANPSHAVPERTDGSGDAVHSHVEKRKKAGASVDIVADNGAEWVKLSTISETRLLFEIARRGWERHPDDSSDSENDVSAGRKDYNNDESLEDDISILRAAEELSRASRATRVRYRHPRIRMVLPKIVRGRVKAIDDLLDDIQALGVQLQTADVLASTGILKDISMEEALRNLILDDAALLTPTVNIDCTILLAIVSDLSNKHVEKDAWLHIAAKRQIEMEEEQNLLPSVLMPAMGARKLVCTREAATRMQEIVMTIGTESEKARTHALLSDMPGIDSRVDRLAAFARLSDHNIPERWQLPIEIVETEAHLPPGLPAIAENVANELSELNRSVFLYGWQRGITTLTSNRTIARRIQTIVEQSLEPDSDEITGPDLWICATARSLLAKEKNREGPQTSSRLGHH